MMPINSSIKAEREEVEPKASVKNLCKNLQISSLRETCLHLLKDKCMHRHNYLVTSAKLDKVLGKGGYIVVRDNYDDWSTKIDGTWQKRIEKRLGWSSEEVDTFCKKVENIVYLYLMRKSIARTEALTTLTKSKVRFADPDPVDLDDVIEGFKRVRLPQSFDERAKEEIKRLTF